MSNLQICLFQLSDLATLINPKNKRIRVKKTPFKVLQAIYQITRTNENKGRHSHYPSKELIAHVAGCGRRQVTEVINAEYFKEFCEVYRDYDIVKKRFKSNRYVLKQEVYEFFGLFWRSGMMKHYRTNWDWWISDFKKRIYNWLIPLLDKGNSVRDILETVMNKLSTKKGLKGAADKCLKGADINPTGLHKDYVLELNRENPVQSLPVFGELTMIGNQMANRFQIKEADINSIMRAFRPIDLKNGYRIHCKRLESGFKPVNPTAAFIDAIKKGKGNAACLR